MRDRAMTGYTPRLTPGVTPEDIVHVTSRVVMCDGGGGALGHPAVALRIEDREVTCPYCSRTYRLADGAAADGHHH
jgi:uncharacterized Zn-finger protein